ncbi:IclR family transcriptional regulator [Actinoallomurus acanthiterrae]
MSGTEIEKRGGGGTEAAARVADVLLLFISGPDSLGVSTISRELGLAKAVVHRILTSLASREMVIADEATRGYRLGPAAAALGARALRDSDLRSAARPVLRRLREETGETSTLSQLVGDSRVYLDQFASPHEIKMLVEIGRAFPLHAGSSSKAILAHLPEARREAILRDGLAPLTSQTIRDADRLRTALAEIVRDGVAVSRGERRPDAGSVAAPVFDVDGVRGSISLCGPIDRFGPDDVATYAPLVRAAAEEISQALGGRSGLRIMDGKDKEA